MRRWESLARTDHLNPRPRVVVVGAGFAGLWAARRLAKGEVDVLLLDRNNYHTFLPLLYQVAAAELGPSEIAYPVRSIFREKAHFTFRMEAVEQVRLEERVVQTATATFAYDYLILGLGSVPNFFGVEGAAEHAFPLREMEQAVPLRHHLLSCFEAAACETDLERRRELLTFAIVGGGPTGVEYAGALAELIFGPLKKDYPTLDLDRDVRILLLEATHRLLLGMPDSLGRYAEGRLRDRRVEVHLGARVERVTPREVVLVGGQRLPTETVVWTAGMKGADAVAGWGLPVARDGRVTVEKTLQVPNFPRVYVAGDLTYLEHEGTPIPGVAPAAMQEGDHAAMNILRDLRGEPLQEFRFKDPGMLAVIGRNNAVAFVSGRAFKGFSAWLLWLVIHVAKLIGFRNRILVLINWAWNYISFERAVRLILPYTRPLMEEAAQASREGAGSGSVAPPRP